MTDTRKAPAPATAGEHPRNGLTLPRLALPWEPSAHLRRLLTLTMLTLLGALLLGQPALLVLAAPLLWALAVGGRRPSYGAAAGAEVAARRCFEGEEITVCVRVRVEGPLDQLGVELVPSPAAALADGERTSVVAGASELEHRWVLLARRWGRWAPGSVRVTARGPGRLFAAEATLPLDEVEIFPRPPALSQLVLPASLRTWIGDHVSRVPGEGTEFAGIRPYVPGDTRQRVNWAVSTRRGRLHVNQFATERAVDVVAVIDALSDVGPWGRSSLDLAVRGAAGLAQAYLAAGGDRVGVVALGGMLRWLGPDVGERQFYRVVETVLDVRRDASAVSPDIDRIPRRALPPGALVVMFSPLLDDRAADAARDLRERGFPLVVVDVLTVEPAPRGRDRLTSLALRLWRLDRRALAFRLADLGVPVVPWDGRETLDDALRPLTRRPILGSRS